MPWLRSSANKVQTNAFCCCLIVNYGVALHRTCYTIVCRNRHGIFWGLIFGPGIFLGLDFWLHSIIPVTWNPEYPPGIASYQLLLKQDRALVKQSTYFFDRWIWNFFFFFFTFRKKWVGRAMGNQSNILLGWPKLFQNISLRVIFILKNN